MALITIKIERTVRSPKAPRARQRRRAVAVLGAAAVLVGGLLAASAAQAAGVVSIPPKVLLNKVTLGAHNSVAVSVLGGSTTVPTDATRVALAGTVSNATANGSLFAYPQGHKAGASGDRLAYTAGHTATGDFTEPVGTNDKVTFANQGSAAIRLSVSLTGYSTEVRASDISATGGAAGQVLTNTGTGAAWQPAGHAYGAFNNTEIPLSNAETDLATLDVPAGSYTVSFTTTLENRASSTDKIECELLGPQGVIGADEFGTPSPNTPLMVLTSEGFADTNGGTISAACFDLIVDNPNPAAALGTELIANGVGTLTDQSNAPAHHDAAPAPQRPPTPDERHPTGR